MKVKNLFGLSALLFAAGLTSCSSDDFVENSTDTDTTTTPQTLHFTATIGQKGEGTRGLKEEDTYVDAFWQVGEKIAIVQDGKKLDEAEVMVVDGYNGSATIEGNLEGGEAGEVQLIFPASAVGEDGEILTTLLHNQEGTLEKVAEKYDVAAVTATLSVNEGSSTATLAEDYVKFENLYSICKFEFPTISDVGVKRVVIKDGEGNLLSGATVDEKDQSNVVYMVMAPFKNGDDYVSKQLQFTVVGGNMKPYSATATATVKESKFYKLSVGVKEIENAIDLGLPSGLLWATVNVGATKETDYGDHFAWGETEPKNSYTWTNYKHCNGSETTLTKYNFDPSYGTVDNKTTLEPEDDAATVNWGKPWRMPTFYEMNELLYNTTYKYVSDYNGSGVAGMEFTSTVEGFTDQKIFLPAGGYRDGQSLNIPMYGYYRTSSLFTTNPDYARYLMFYDSGYASTSWRNHLRFYGFSVRAVRP